MKRGKSDGNSVSQKEIKVRVHIPEKVSEAIRQNKINTIYDILKPKNSEDAM